MQIDASRPNATARVAALTSANVLAKRPPRHRMRGGDQPRGGKPSGIGHAGRQSLAYIAAALLFLLQAITLLACILPSSAYADTEIRFENGGVATLRDDGHITGTAHIDDWVDDLGEVYPVTLPDGAVIEGHCLHYMHYAPAPGDYPFDAEPQGNGVYKVTVDSTGAAYSTHMPPAYSPFLSPAQAIGEIFWSPTITGRLKIHKSSALPGVSGQNGNYSLAGARYGVWHDEACTQGTGAAFDLFTNENGESNEVVLAPGQYWVKEADAPKGFALDTTPHAVTIDPGKTTVLETDDIPLYESPEVWATKTGIQYQSGDQTQLEGAEFTVRYYDGSYTEENLPKKPTRTWVLKSDKDGKIIPTATNLVSGDEFYKNDKDTVIIPLGTVTVQETKAPKGYQLEGQTPDSPSDYTAPIHLTTVDGTGSFRAVTVEDEEKPSRAGISLQKTDSQTGKTPQGDASLAGIRFVIINKNDKPVLVNGVTYNIDEEIGDPLVTDKNGSASTTNDYLPLGTYEIRESATNKSMTLDAKPQTVTLTAANSNKLVSLKNDMPNNVVRGGLAVGKISRETNAHLTQGEAKLSGALFVVELASGNPVVVDGALHNPGDVVCSLVTNDDGVANTDTHALPYGTYTVREDEPPVGFLPNNDWSKTVTIREDGVVIDLSGEDDSANDQVVRGGFNFIKVDEVSKERMPFIPWLITSNTTGESHVIVADENGVVDTESASHSTNTNANDNAYANDSIDESLLDANAGIWFSGRTDLQTSPNNDMGALPYDTYTVQELASSKNNGYDLVSFTVRIDQHNVNVDMGTVDNRPSETPQIGTTLTFGEQEHIAPVSETITLVDTVAYDGLIPNKEYTIRGELKYKHNGEDVVDKDGKPVTSSTTFTPKTKQGTVQVEFELDSSALEGKSVVAFEYLLREDNQIAFHTELEDHDQTVDFPRIGTTLTDKEGSHEVKADESITLVDTVDYDNLVPNTRYDLKGVLMDKVSGKPFTDDSGQEIHATTSFVPTESSGSTTVEFSFMGKLAQGKVLVAFETLSRLDIDLVTHADIDDTSQTVHIPSIRTELSDERGHHVVTGTERMELCDTVTYSGLTPEKEYEVEGTLVYKDTGEPVLLNSGEEVRATTKFTPDQTTGSVILTFSVDVPPLMGREVVAFETLRREGREVAIHADLEDESQTAYIPAIHTTLLSEDGTHFAKADRVKLTDKVEYKALRTGIPYTLVGSLVDKSNGKPISVKDGTSVKSTVTFTPETTDGTVDMVFELDTSDFAGQTLVAFEYLHEGESEEGREIATHADLDSDEQTIGIPSIKTTATNSANGGKTFEESEHVRIKDVVHYEGLIPGKSYVMEGTLYDKDSGKPIMTKENKSVTSSVTFEPTKSSGDVEIFFEFEGTIVTGSGVVAFETCRFEDKEIAVHADLKDESQTVTIKRPDKTTEHKETTSKETTSKASGRTAVPSTGDPTQILFPVAIAAFSLTILVVRRLLQ